LKIALCIKYDNSHNGMYQVSMINIFLNNNKNSSVFIMFEYLMSSKCVVKTHIQNVYDFTLDVSFNSSKKPHEEFLNK